MTFWLTPDFKGIKIPRFILIEVYIPRGHVCFNTRISALEKIGTNPIAKAIVQQLASSLRYLENPNKYRLKIPC